jgi:hypothetical protein
MGTEQGRDWTQIASSVILGGAAVLAAMVPLYCAKQNRLKEAVSQTQTADSENSALKEKLAGLESQIQKQDDLIKKLQNPGGGSHAGPAPAPEVTPGPLSREVVDHDFRFHLNGCSLENSVVRCNLLVTNQFGDRVLNLRTESRIISDSADEYPATGFTLGAQSSRYGVNPVLPGGVPVKAHLDFGSVRPGTKKLALLEIYCYAWTPQGSREEFTIKFKEVDL